MDEDQSAVIFMFVSAINMMNTMRANLATRRRQCMELRARIAKRRQQNSVEMDAILEMMRCRRRLILQILAEQAAQDSEESDSESNSMEEDSGSECTPSS